MGQDLHNAYLGPGIPRDEEDAEYSIEHTFGRHNVFRFDRKLLTYKIVASCLTRETADAAIRLMRS